MKRLAFSAVTVVIALVVCEVGARIIERRPGAPKVQLDLTLQPYVMSTGPSNETVTWTNVLDHNKAVPSTLRFNNFGYTESIDYTMVPDAAYLAKYGKKPGEKIVLLSGGSVVYGVGATANDKTIAARMQHYLNERAPGAKWRVLNMAMASWIAYQQFVGLSLFGAALDPDWIVVMDGHNDGVVPCAHGSGAGQPLGWPALLAMQEGLTATPPDDGVLGRAVRVSALARLATGTRSPGAQPPVDRRLTLDPEDPDRRFFVKMANLDFSVQDRQIDFYLRAERDVTAFFSKANILMSTQPVMYDNAITPLYRKAFAPGATRDDRARLEDADDAYMKEHGTDRCGTKVASAALGYFLGKSAIKLNDMMEMLQAGDRARALLYYNTEWSMPLDETPRRPYFIDNAHMSDLGQDRVGEFLAEAVLGAERGGRFDLGKFVAAHSR